MIASLRETIDGAELLGPFEPGKRAPGGNEASGVAAADTGVACRRVLFPPRKNDRRRLASILLPPDDGGHDQDQDGDHDGDQDDDLDDDEDEVQDREDREDQDDDDDEVQDRDDDDDAGALPLWARPLQPGDPGNLRAATDMYALYIDGDKNKRCRTPFEMVVSLLVSGRKNTILYYKKRDREADLFPPVCEVVRPWGGQAWCHGWGGVFFLF